MNLSWSQKILEALSAQGVEEFVFCAGARNSPLVFALDRAKGLRAYSFFEERSAAFFALGCARVSGRPVAVITTSGTAAAELLPAAIEAFHTGVPVIMVTADRPKRLRGTGAPQAIDQTGLFAKFIEREFDLANGEMPSFDGWSRRAPLHLNVCFDEPLIDEKLEAFQVKAKTVDSFYGLARNHRETAAIHSDQAASALCEFIKSSPGQDLMVLVGTLETTREREAVAAFLKKLNAPTYFEAPSGLREDPSLASFALRSGDKILPLAIRKFGVRRVLRLGSVPTARVWRDLEDPSVQAETFSLSPLPFSGLSRGTFFCCDLAMTLAATTLRNDPWQPAQKSKENPLLQHDREIAKQLEKLFSDEPLSEPSLFRALSEQISSSARVYVGNSLPIREWDLAATLKTSHVIEANRGVNGIDGQVSTFLGMTNEQRDSWCVIGDLTAMYDLAAPWAALQKKPGALTVVVVNNGGGKIFHRIFDNPLFENRHDFDFSNWAAQWRWHYEAWTKIPKAGSESIIRPRIVELLPDTVATQRFWDRYDGFFK